MLIVYLLFPVISLGYTADDPVVTTSLGKIKGQSIGSRSEKMDRFLSIPYAEKPVGDLRFKATVPKKSWAPEVYDASADLDPRVRVNTCMQLALTQRRTRGSEDCLYLNVWVNGGVEAAKQSPLPVIVWIHGGAFVLGSSWGANLFDNWLYDLESMVRHGNLIGVSLNYRMGPLGFLSTGDSEAPGNYGFLDQVEALKWVKNNIWAFGGDPNSITVFGESAGGASTSLLQLSPLSTNLFHRGISQSGTALSPWAVVRDPSRWAVEVAAGVNCPTVDNAAMLACLREADPVDINMAVLLLDLDREILMDLPWGAVIDGNFLPDEPAKLVGNSAHIDYLVGHNNMDAHLFVGVPFPRMNVDFLPMHRSDLERAARIHDYEVPLNVQNALVDLYDARKRPVDDETFYKRAVLNLFTDAHFAGPSHNLAYLHDQQARIDGTQASTYVYVFSHPSKMPFIYMPWMGADHADDLQYVFAKPLRNKRGIYKEEEVQMSKALMTYWTNFAWTGDPNNGPNGHIAPAYWKSYDFSGSRNYLEINGTLSANGDKALQSDYRSEEFTFWREEVPRLWNRS